MFDKQAVAIAYYSAMGRYWLNRFFKYNDKESEANVIIYATKLVEAIKG